MNGFYFDEPELEFGLSRHIDIRAGLTHYGPLDRSSELAPQRIRLGVVGDKSSIDRFCNWVNTCRGGIQGKETRLFTLFPGFPGFGANGPFCDIVCDQALLRAVSPSAIRDLSSIGDRNKTIKESTQLFIEEFHDIADKSIVDVGVLLFPESLMRVIDATSNNDNPDEERALVWHDYVKAQSLALQIPVQVVRPATYGGNVHRFRSDGSASKDVEDEASRAWNFFTALYYKAGGIPWRLVRSDTDLASCYIGVSFFHSPDGDQLQTSVAQLFDERGQGVVVKGGQATIIKDDRTVHLSDEAMEVIIRDVVSRYKREHKHFPARIVVHKTSYFSEEEIQGVRSAAGYLGVDSCELLSMRRSSTRFFRNKSYPPLRGTAIEMDCRRVLLYTQGSVDYYRSCPSKHVPRPLEILLDDTESGVPTLIPEILALTKMNWNSTRFVNAEPITVAAARKVGDVIRYLGDKESMHSRYSYFM